RSQPANGPIVPGRAPTARLPAVHPLAALGVRALPPFRRAGFDESFFRCEELVVCREDSASESFAGKIRQISKLERWFAHDVGWPYRGSPNAFRPPTNVARTSPWSSRFAYGVSRWRWRIIDGSTT